MIRNIKNNSKDGEEVDLESIDPPENGLDFNKFREDEKTYLKQMVK